MTSKLLKIKIKKVSIQFHHRDSQSAKNCIVHKFHCSLQVYEEKEKMWERELRKIKGLYENRLRASQQKSSKMEQALTNQTYQVSTSRTGKGC